MYTRAPESSGNLAAKIGKAGWAETRDSRGKQEKCTLPLLLFSLETVGCGRLKDEQVGSSLGPRESSQ